MRVTLLCFLLYGLCVSTVVKVTPRHVTQHDFITVSLFSSGHSEDVLVYQIEGPDRTLVDLRLNRVDNNEFSAVISVREKFTQNGTWKIKSPTETDTFIGDFTVTLEEQAQLQERAPPLQILNVTVDPTFVDLIENETATIDIFIDAPNGLCNSIQIVPFDYPSNYNAFSISFVSNCRYRLVPSSPFVPNGTYYINYLYIYDSTNSSNFIQIGSPGYLTWEYNPLFTVRSNEDVRPPELVDVEIYPSIINMTLNETETVNITFSVTDDISGVWYVQINVVFPASYYLQSFVYYFPSQNVTNGTGSVAFTVGPSSPYYTYLTPGVMRMYVLLTDRQQNTIQLPLGRTIEFVPNNMTCTVDNYEYNDASNTPWPISVPYNNNASLCPTGDQDYYKFTLSKNSSITILLTGDHVSTSATLVPVSLLTNCIVPTTTQLPLDDSHIYMLLTNLTQGCTYSIVIQHSSTSSPVNNYNLLIIECGVHPLSCGVNGVFNYTQCKCVVNVQNTTTTTTSTSTSTSTTGAATIVTLTSSGGITTGLLAGIIVIAVVVPVLLIVAAIILYRKYSINRNGGGTSLEMGVFNDIKKVKDITVVQKIGSGNFSTVYKGIMGGTIPVALKLPKETGPSFVNEALILQSLNHKNILLFYGIYIDKEGLSYLVVEYLSMGSLASLVESRFNDLKYMDFVAISRDIAAGMCNMHQNQIIHRDLALRNMLVAPSSVPPNQFIIKVADMGLSVFLKSEYYTSDNKDFAIKWASPEVIKDGKFSAHSDVWSFGVTLWELFSGGQPYFGLDTKDAIDKILAGNQLPKPPSCPDEIYSIMKACWQIKPADRISSEEIYKKLDAIFKQLLHNMPEATTHYEAINSQPIPVLTEDVKTDPTEQIYN